jgi:hypothetical protein
MLSIIKDNDKSAMKNIDKPTLTLNLNEVSKFTYKKIKIFVDSIKINKIK